MDCRPLLYFHYRIKTNKKVSNVSTSELLFANWIHLVFHHFNEMHMATRLTILVKFTFGTVLRCVANTNDNYLSCLATCIRRNQQRHATKTLLQQNPTVVNWACRLMQVDVYSGCKKLLLGNVTEAGNKCMRHQFPQEQVGG